MTGDRPSKKQRELLSFIDGFIKGNGYGPSYREIMRALNYKSVSTVAVHIDGLIKKGQLIKHDRSARSLEVVGDEVSRKAPINNADSHQQWLTGQAGRLIDKYNAEPNEDTRSQAITLIESLEILGFSQAASEARERLNGGS